jgi:hypothetical protein
MPIGFTGIPIHGRLSMWRGFGGSAPRVAIVLNIPWYSHAAVAMHLLFSPVAYLAEPGAHLVWEEVTENIRANSALLREVDRLAVINSVFVTLLVGVVCLKHEGFHEEREWRAIYHPKRWLSQLIEPSTEVIAGVPQIVYKIPLDATVSESLADSEFSKIFDRLIVGPTIYPWPMCEAFTEGN